MAEPQRSQPRSLVMRVWRSIRREPLWPTDDRGRMRLALNDLILHLHPPKVPAAAIKLTYTYGLGGMAILLLLTLIATGVMLSFAYTPSPDMAFRSIIRLQTEIAFGQFVRNVHHWSANLLLLVAVLHLLRVFYTGAFAAPRQFNWVLGLIMLGLVAASNFTGYLLPWDQLAYWAITVVAGLIAYIPLVGPALRDFVIGGPEVGATTLSNFFSLHVFMIPLGLFIVGSFHIWRVRKDKITVPRTVQGKAPEARTVTTIPHLVSRELAVALVLLALLFTWSAWVNAPLGSAANPSHPPNPIRTAWYFVGLQELLLHFHPFVGAVVIPALSTGALLLLPYLPQEALMAGVWFRSSRGRRLAALSALVGVVSTALLVVLSETGFNWQILLAGVDPLISNGLIPLTIVVGLVFGYARLLRRSGATRDETRQALFTLLLFAFITLTAIGLWFRGENWVLQLPWGN